MPMIINLPTKPRLNRFLVGVSLILIIFTVNSTNVAAQKVLTLNDAIRLTFQLHPDLKSFVYMAQSSDGLIEQAGVSSPVILNASVEDFMGTGSYSGVSGLQTTLSISWLLDRDRISSRIKLASSKASLNAVHQDITALNVAAQTAKAFIALLSQKEQLKLAKLAEQQSKDILKDISVRVNAGKLNVVDQLRAQANLAQKTLAVDDVSYGIAASRAQLAAQWQGDTEFKVVGSLGDLPTINQVNTLYTKLKSNPRARLFMSEQRIVQSDIELAQATAKPTWQVYAGIKRNEVVDDFAFTAGVSIPLGADNRNRGQIISLNAQKNKIQAQADAWYRRVSTQVLLLTQKLKHNRHVIDVLVTATIPPLELANRKAAAAYKLGRYSYTDWHGVQQELINSQKSLIAAYTNIQLFNIELERLTGASILNKRD